MKKFTGWLMIILCSVFLLIFVIGLIAIIPGMTTKIDTKEAINSIVGFVVVVSLLSIGIINGLKRIKKDKPVGTIDYTDTLNINLTGRIAYKDYRNLMLELSFKKPIYIVLIGLMILVLLAYMNDDNGLIQSYSYIFIFSFLGFALIPLVILTQSKKAYQTNSIFQERLNYQLTNDSIYIKGETIDSIQKWIGFYKIKETKVFFLFYQGEGIATLLDKKMFTDNELVNFRRFIGSLNLQRV